MQAGPNPMHFWNDDYDDDLACSFFKKHVLSISLYIFRALRNSVSDRMAYMLNGAWHMRDQIYVLAFPLLY